MHRVFYVYQLIYSINMLTFREGCCCRISCLFLVCLLVDLSLVDLDLVGHPVRLVVGFMEACLDLLGLVVLLGHLYLVAFHLEAYLVLVAFRLLLYSVVAYLYLVVDHLHLLDLQPCSNFVYLPLLVILKHSQALRLQQCWQRY